MNSHKVQIRVNNYIFKLKNRLSVWGGVRSVVCKPIFLPEIYSMYTIPDNDWVSFK